MSSLGTLRTIKRYLHTTAERLGTVFYTKKQSYEATLKLELHNRSAQKLSFIGVLAVPNEYQYQKILSGPSFFFNGVSGSVSLQKDEQFGNRYAVFEKTLEADETFVVEEKFSIQVEPFLEYVKNSPMSENVVQYLSPNPLVSSDDPRIVAMAQKIQKNRDDAFAVIQDINHFVLEYLTYGNPLPGLYSSTEALEKKTVDCGGFDTLFVALCRALGVPARVVSGFWAGYSHNSMHAWAEFMLPGSGWVAVDPSVEQLFLQGRTKKSGRFGVVGSDRITLSVGESIPLLLHGQKVMTDILQNPLIYDASGREISGISKNITFLTKTL